MASAGTVNVDFAAETAKFTSELKKVRGELKGMNDGFATLKRVATTALGVFSVNLLVGFVRRQAEAADALGKTADKLNLSTQALTAFDLAAQDAGVSLEAAHKLLLDSQRRLGDAASGSGEAAKALKLLNLNVKDLINLAPDELFARYSEQIARLRTPAERLAVAQQLFGKQAQEAFTLIEAGRPALLQAAATTERYGLALTRIDIAKIEQANDKIGLLAKISETAGQRIAAGFAPFVSAIADELLGAAGNTEVLQQRAEQFGAAAYAAFQIVANAARAMQAAFFGAAAGGARLLQAVTWGDVSKAFAASVDANLAKADEALQRIKSIAEIQSGIVDVLERARTNAAAALKPPVPAAAGVSTVNEDPFGRTAEQRQRDLDEANQQTQQVISTLNSYLYDQEKARQKVFADGQALALQQLKELSEKEVAENMRRVAAQEEAERQILAFRVAGLDAAGSLLQAHFGKSKAIQTAAFLLQKRQAIAQAIVATKVAVLESYRNAGGYPFGIVPALKMAAIGALQIADIAAANPGFSGGASGAGGSASLATPSNDVFSRQNNDPAGDQQRGVAARPVYQIHFNGNVYGAGDFKEYLANTIRELDDIDAVLFSPTGRQAMEIRGGT